MKTTEYHLPGDPPLCPECNRKQDGALGMRRMPETGDYCVCVYCATISRYAVDAGVYTLRKADEEDMEVARKDGILDRLVATQDFVKHKIRVSKNKYQ